MGRSTRWGLAGAGLLALAPGQALAQGSGGDPPQQPGSQIKQAQDQAR